MEKFHAMLSTQLDSVKLRRNAIAIVIPLHGVSISNPQHRLSIPLASRK